MLLLLTFACTSGTPDDSPPLTEKPAPTESVRDRLARYLSGTFDSADQAAEDREYYAVQYQGCLAPNTGQGEVVLYIEQALIDTVDEPYRQRLYVIEEGDDPATEAVSKVYEWRQNRAYAGFCQGQEVSDWGEPSWIEGCDVTLAWDGEKFVGGTDVGTCASALYDEDYTTSVVTLTESYMESWDRGWYADGTQAWGVSGGPYHFVRRTEISAYEAE